MLPHSGKFFAVCFCLCCCSAFIAPAQAGAPQMPGQTQSQTQNQRDPQQQTPTLPSLGPPADNSPDPFGASMEARRLRMQNDDRHKRLVADTEKLVSLSAELKEDVSKAGKNELSLDVIKKAAEIEKLAHDVKERMRS